MPETALQTIVIGNPSEDTPEGLYWADWMRDIQEERRRKLGPLAWMSDAINREVERRMFFGDDA